MQTAEEKRAYNRQRYKEKREEILQRNKDWNAANPGKVAANHRAWKAKNQNRVRELNRASHMRRNYGITPEIWSEMFTAQGNCCAICKSADPRDIRGWHIDHCHGSGAVRGILCTHCNRMVHKYASPEILEAAANYLRR